MIKCHDCVQGPSSSSVTSKEGSPFYYCYKCFERVHQYESVEHMFEKLSIAEIMHRDNQEGLVYNYSCEEEGGYSSGQYSDRIEYLSEEERSVKEPHQEMKTTFEYLKKDIEKDCEIFSSELATFNGEVKEKEIQLDGRIRVLEVLQAEYEKLSAEKRTLTADIDDQITDFERETRQILEKKTEVTSKLHKEKLESQVLNRNIYNEETSKKQNQILK